MNPYAAPGVSSPGSPTDAAYRAGPFEITEVALSLLRETRPWVIFLSILAFLGSGLMLLAAFGVMVASVGASRSAFSWAIGLIYLPFALFYVYPAVKLWMYGRAIGSLLLTRSTGDLEAALLQQKHFWKFSGIAAVVMIVLYMGLMAVFAVMGFMKATGKAGF